MTTSIRRAREEDVEFIISLFDQAFGSSYCDPHVYEQEWQTERISDDNWQVLIAEMDRRPCGVAMTRFDTMTMADKCIELWINIVEKSCRQHGIAAMFTAHRLERLQWHKNFCYALNVANHDFSQKLDEKNGLVPIGFLPLRDFYTSRKSYALHGKVFPRGIRYRRRHPQIISGLEKIAKHVLQSTGLPLDYDIVDPAKTAFHSMVDIVFENPAGVSWLALQDVCRQSPRYIPGRINLRNNQDLDALRSGRIQGLVAIQDGVPIGAVALLLESHNNLLEILDIVAINVATLHGLLDEVDRLAKTNWKIAYAETNVNAFEPQMQKMLHDLGFMPVAYCPSMASIGGVAFDVIRMSKIYQTSAIGPLKLTPPARVTCELVLEGFPELANKIAFI